MLAARTIMLSLLLLDIYMVLAEMDVIERMDIDDTLGIDKYLGEKTLVKRTGGSHHGTGEAQFRTFHYKCIQQMIYK